MWHVGVSKNRGTPKSSILIRFSIINHPFWDTPFWKHPNVYTCLYGPFLCGKMFGQAPILRGLDVEVDGLARPKIPLDGGFW